MRNYACGSPRRTTLSAWDGLQSGPNVVILKKHHSILDITCQILEGKKRRVNSTSHMNSMCVLGTGSAESTQGCRRTTGIKPFIGQAFWEYARAQHARNCGCASKQKTSF